MANEVKLLIRVSDDGSLDIVAKDAKKAAKATDDVARSTDKASKSRQKYSKGEKGVAGATSNSTKAFSKMRESMTGGGGLVPAYATLAANVFALSAAFGVLRRAAQVEQLTQGLSEMGRASGLAMGSLSKGLQEATKNALTLEEAMRATSMITSAGLDPSMVQQFGEAAQKAAVALGRNTQDSLERFTRGVTKLEPELLDELGLFVRLDEATETYAREIGKTASQLTNFERRQAFANATLDQAREKFGQVEVDANSYDKLAAAFADLSKAGLNLLNNVLEPMISFLAGSTTALIGAMALFASTISGQLVGSLASYADRARNIADANKGLNKNTRVQLNLFNRSSSTLKNLSESLRDGSASTKEYQTAVDGQIQSMRTNLGLRNKGAQAEEEYTKRVKTAKNAINEIRGAEVRQRVSSAALAESKAINALQAGKYRVALKNLRRSMLLYRGALTAATKSQGVFTKALRVGGVGLKAFGTAARLAGAALSTLLGPISTAILVFSLLKEGFDALMNAFKTEETKALEAKFEELKETSKELKDNFKEVDQAFEGLSKKINSRTQAYIAYGNSLSTVIEKVKEIGDTEAQGALAAQVDFLQESIDNSEQLSASLEKAYGTDNLKKLGLSYKEVVPEILNFIEAQRALGSRVAAVKEAFEQAGIAAADYFNKLKPNTAVTQTAEGLEQVYNAASTLRIGEDGQVVLGEQFDKLPKVLKNFISNINVETQKEPIKIAMAANENALKSVQAQIDELFFGQGVPPEDPRLQALGKQAQQLRNNIKQLKGGLLNLDESGVLLTQLKIATDMFQAEEIRLITATKLIATRQAELNEIKALGGVTEAQQQRIIDAENRLNLAKQANIKAQISFLDNLIKSVEGNTTLVDQEAERARLKALLKQLQEEEIKGLENSLRLSQSYVGSIEMRQKGQKALLDLQEKSATYARQELSSERILLENQQKRLNRLNVLRNYNPALTAQDQLKIEEQLFAKKLEAAINDYKISKQKVELEYDLLDARLGVIQAELKLEAARARKAGDTESASEFESLSQSVETARGNLGDLEQAAMSGLAATFEATLSTLTQDYRTKLTAATEEGLSQTQKGSTTERIQGLGQAMDTGEELPLSKTLEGYRGALTPFMEDLAKLGPEGEFITSIAQGAFVVGESWSQVGEIFSLTGEQAASTAQKTQAVAAAVGASIGAIGQIMQAQSQAQISAIDKQIAAEKKRDGKSAASLARIQKLEKKKEAMKKKAFEQQKKIQMASVVANTAAAIAGAFAPPPIGLGFPGGMKLAAMYAALGAAQLAVISSTSYSGGAGSSSSSVPSSVSVGERKTSTDLAKSQGGGGELAYFRGARGQGGPENFKPAFSGMRYRANGGNTAFMVGEQGPELFVPETPGRIVPNDEVDSAGTPVNATINISAVDAAGVEDVLMNQRGNIISMIRDAANAQGNTFLEEINVAEL